MEGVCCFIKALHRRFFHPPEVGMPFERFLGLFGCIAHLRLWRIIAHLRRPRDGWVAEFVLIGGWILVGFVWLVMIQDEGVKGVGLSAF